MKEQPRTMADATAEELATLISDKYRRVADLFLTNGFNRRKAARDAGYTDIDRASRILQKPEVARYVRARLAEAHLSAEEVRARIENIASFDIDEFMTVDSHERSYWQPARRDERVQELARERRLPVGDLDDVDLGIHFGEDAIAQTLAGETLILVREIRHEVRVDWAAVKKAGMFGMFSQLEFQPDGTVKWKGKDDLRALELLGKIHKLFADRNVIENPDGTAVKFIVGVGEDAI